MGCLRRLVLELTGRFDRAAMRGLLDRAAGVEASEVVVEFRTVDIDRQALATLAAIIRRAKSHIIIRVRGLSSNHAEAFRQRVPEGVVVGVRPSAAENQASSS
jgi:hypothetical protein